MTGLSFDIKEFEVGTYNASYENYNVYFSEYLIPADKVDEIAEVKDSDIKYYELENGDIHFSQTKYENIIKQMVE